MSQPDLAGRDVLFPIAEPEVPLRSGLLPTQLIEDLIETGRVSADQSILPEQIQPASLDLRLGAKAYRVRASFLPGNVATVSQRLNELTIDELDLTSSALMETGGVFIVPLSERLNLPSSVGAKANPKSTTGRLDIFVRLITDHAIEFEEIKPGYQGPLFAEIVPRTFSIRVRAGMRLNQLRFVRNASWSSDEEVRKLDDEEALVWTRGARVRAVVDRGLKVSVSLKGINGSNDITAFKARRNSPVIELDKLNFYDPLDFWEPIRTPNGRLILEPSAFYILSSKEDVRVPPKFAAEMVPFDPSIGEYRIHYAGFFDPGFGYGDRGEVKGTPAVLEVRAHEVPFMIEDGRMVGRLLFVPLQDRPTKIYGNAIGSSYQSQGLALSKQFKRL